jgi:hypothetical protein
MHLTVSVCQGAYEMKWKDTGVVPVLPFNSDSIGAYCPDMLNGGFLFQRVLDNVKRALFSRQRLAVNVVTALLSTSRTWAVLTKDQSLHD